MMSFKRILIFLTVSRLMSNLLDFNCGSIFAVADTNDPVKTTKTEDVVVDDEGDVYYDTLTELPGTSEVKKDTDTTGTVSSLPDKPFKTTLKYEIRTVYIPKKSGQKVVRPAGGDSVPSGVIGKRTHAHEKVDSEEAKKPKTTTVPEVKLPEADTADAAEGFQSYGFPPPLPPRTVRFSDLPPEVEKKLVSRPLEMGTFRPKQRTEGKSSSSVVVSDEEISLDVPESGVEHVTLRFTPEDDIPYRKPYEIPSAKMYDRVKSSGKETLSSVSKNVHRAAHKTSKEAGKLADKVKYKSKDFKSHVAEKMVQAKDLIGVGAHQTAKTSAKLGEKIKETSKKHYFKAKVSAQNTVDAASRNIAKAARKTATETGKLGEKLKNKTKVAFKDVKTKTRVTMGEASKKMNEAAEETKMRATRVGQKIKEKSSNIATESKVRLQGATHKVAKEAVKLGDNIKSKGSKTKVSVTKYIRNKFGQLVPEDEVTRL